MTDPNTFGLRTRDSDMKNIGCPVKLNTIGQSTRKSEFIPEERIYMKLYIFNWLQTLPKELADGISFAPPCGEPFG
jgi:hypothetical protein